MENYLQEMSPEQYHLLLVAGLVLNSEVFGFVFHYHHHHLTLTWFACKCLVVPTGGGWGQIWTSHIILIV
jgi:hypothetical protein